MPDPDVKSNLGAFAKYGKLASGEELAAIDEFGAIIGTVGDFAGALTAVVAVVAFFASLGDHPANAIAILQQELSTVDTELRKLIASERVDHLLSRLNDLDTIVAPATTSFQKLHDELPPRPPLTDEDRRNQIGACLTALNALLPDHQWRVNVLETAYFDDGGEWAGQIAADSTGGTAFGGKYVLPRFLSALTSLFAVGVALDQRFVDNWYDAAVKQYLERLKAAYDTSVAGLIALPRPSRDEIFHPIETSDGSGYQFGSWGRGRLALGESVALNRTFYQMYGYVSLYGDFFQVGNYPLDLMAPPEFPASDNYFARYYAAYDLRLLSARKMAYRGLGLGGLREILRKCQLLVGSPPMPVLDPDMVWSVRDVAALVAPAFGGDGAMGKSVRVGVLIDRLNSLSGRRANSLRSALDPLISPVELAPLPDTGGTPDPPDPHGTLGG